MNSKTKTLTDFERSLPLISIGMPVFNGEKFIRGALDSLLAQSFTNFELIISDNASTDNTRDICKEYAERDRRIRYIRQVANIGPVANFQFVFNQAVAEFFMWAAHDDRRHPKALEHMMEVLSMHDDVGLAFSHMSSSDLNTDIKEDHQVGSIPKSMKKYQKYLFRLVDGCPSLIYGLHRVSVLRKIPLDSYDFMDLHLTHWYELNSAILIVPLNLYTAGTDGIRVPYSLNCKRLNAKRYLDAEWKLLNQHFGYFHAIALYLISSYLMRKNIKQLQRQYGI